MVKDKEKASIIGKMVSFIREIGKMGRSMVMVFGNHQVVILIQGNGWKEWQKDLEFYQRKMVRYFLDNFINFKNQVVVDRIL